MPIEAAHAACSTCAAPNPSVILAQMFSSSSALSGRPHDAPKRKCEIVVARVGRLERKPGGRFRLHTSRS